MHIGKLELSALKCGMWGKTYDPGVFPQKITVLIQSKLEKTRFFKPFFPMMIVSAKLFRLCMMNFVETWRNEACLYRSMLMTS